MLLGGCGDVRHFFATIIDAADPARCPSRASLQLRLSLNDHVPEMAARVYVLLVLLDRAAHTLTPPPEQQASDDMPDVASMSDEAAMALTAFWHVYQSALICAPVYDVLLDVLREAASAAGPQLPYVDVSPGSWEQMVPVFGAWTKGGMKCSQEVAQASTFERHYGLCGQINLEVCMSRCRALSFSPWLRLTFGAPTNSTVPCKSCCASCTSARGSHVRILQARVRTTSQDVTCANGGAGRCTQCGAGPASRDHR